MWWGRTAIIRSRRPLFSTIVADRSIDADRVVAILDRIALTRGFPAFVRFDNGPEFIAAAHLYGQAIAALHDEYVTRAMRQRPPRCALPDSRRA